VDDKISQFTEDSASTTAFPAPKTELTSTTDIVSTTNFPTTLDTFSTTDIPTATTLQAEEEVETTTIQVLTTLVPDIESNVKSVTTDGQRTSTSSTTDAQISTTGQISTENIDSTTTSGIVVTESNQLGFDDISEITTNSAEDDESFTENFEDIVFDDIENEISDDPLDTGLQKAALLRGGKKIEVAGGLDFSTAVFDASLGKRCIVKEEETDSFQKTPILECTHKNIETCHYTYITAFKPTSEEVCEENFDKQCSITFTQKAFNETVRKCYKPVDKVCNGSGPEVCQTVYESSCTTKYTEKEPGGKLIGETSCEKLPVEICGAGCSYVEGEEECHDTTLATVVDVPEEVCDLNPQKACRLVTRLVPRLEPSRQCTIVPKETCQLTFSRAAPVKKALVTKWCLDESDLIPEDEADLTEAREESERSGGGEIREESDIIVITSEDLADVDQDIIAAAEDNIFKRNVAIRPRKPKYQTNFI